MEEVIKGNIKSKLKLLILSGIHGDEYNPCILLKFIKEDTTLINFLKDKYKSITFLYNVNTNGIMKVRL
jgi:succinylglutamate desuccinylase